LREIESDPQYGATLALAIRLVFLLFLMVETAPVVGKVLLPRSAYDAILDSRDNAVIAHSGAMANGIRRSLEQQSDHEASLTEQARAFEREAFRDMLAALRSSAEFAQAQRERTSCFVNRLRVRLAKFISPDE
jgi:hypothetical protein